MNSNLLVGSHPKASAITRAVVLLASLPLPAFAGPEAKAPDTAKPRALARVAVSRDIPYCDVPGDPDRKRHQLDVYRPEGKDGCPVLFFVHGGAWVTGWKDDVFGVYGYGTIAESL